MSEAAYVLFVSAFVFAVVALVSAVWAHFRITELEDELQRATGLQPDHFGLRGDAEEDR